MKLDSSHPQNNTARLLTIILLYSFSMFLGCAKEDPQKEAVPELITEAILTFTPKGGGNSVVVTASDPDGEGVQNIKVNGSINLLGNKTYLLTIDLINGLADPTTPEYNISDEIEKEGDEHILFFSWTNNAYANPAGNGNIDNRKDPVNYSGDTNSKDANGLALGLTTIWTTEMITGATIESSFRLMLKHQPGLKTDTSDSNMGETDLDITFTLNII
ncbi:MAG: GTP cyclohydrolase [Bacteroidia bacterium]|nr:GTP cyclohydrolase [Bacteroidia bacterium]